MSQVEQQHLDIDSWSKLKKQMASYYGDAVYKTWLRHLKFIDVKQGELTLSVPTRFIKEWINNNYRNYIIGLCSECYGEVHTLNILVQQKHTSNEFTSTVAGGVDIKGQNVRVMDAMSDDFSSPLDRRFTFDNFVVSASNELSYAAARSVANSGEEAPVANPLFIHGGVGLGKTHLMHAVALHLKEKSPHLNVVYMSAEKFMYQFVKALRAGDVMAFKERFRAVDVMLIDDVQFICGKGGTQEEFFHTFDALFNQNKQIIISGSKHPCDLDGLDERICSRLSGGLVVDIGHSDYDLRLGVLKNKVTQINNVDIPDNVLEFLAEKITSNIRELEGSLNKVVAHAMLVNKTVTLESVQTILSDLLRVRERVLSIVDIQKKVADYYNIKLADLSSATRLRAIARPRQVAMYLSKKLTTRSLSEIGRKFGGKDHTTVMHAVKRVEELSQNESEFSEDLKLLMRALKEQ